MRPLKAVQISGTGMAVPERVVTNNDLATILDTSDEWIVQRTGIRERRHLDPGMRPSDLALSASQQALRCAGLEAQDLDLVIVATLSPEHYFPGTSAFLQRKLGLGTTPAMDVRSQCSGFLYALNVGQLYVASGQYRRVLVCGVEAHSPGLDMTPRGRDVSALFGDGAGAVVLEPSDDPERGIVAVKLHTEGVHAERLWVEAPTMASVPAINAAMVEEARVYPKMDGPHVFRHAIARMPEVIREVLAETNLTVEDIDLFLFHQANLRINEAVARNLGIPLTKTYNNIDKYGNCSAAAIPMLLDECLRAGRIRPGSLVCMTAFGAGFAWGSVLVRW